MIRPIQLYSLARSARNFLLRKSLIKYVIDQSSYIPWRGAPEIFIIFLFENFFQITLTPPPPDYLFSEAGRARTFPPHSLSPPQNFGPPQAEKFWGILEEILLFEKQKSRIFVLCKKYVFFITYSDLLSAAMFFENLFLQIFEVPYLPRLKFYALKC